MQVGLVAASQKLLKILTIRICDQLYQRCLWHCKNVSKTLYADVTPRYDFCKIWTLLFQTIKFS